MVAMFHPVRSSTDGVMWSHSPFFTAGSADSGAGIIAMNRFTKLFLSICQMNPGVVLGFQSACACGCANSASARCFLRLDRVTGLAAPCESASL